MPDVEVGQSAPAGLAEEVRTGDGGLERVPNHRRRAGIDSFAPRVGRLEVKTRANLFFDRRFQGVVEGVSSPIQTADVSHIGIYPTETRRQRDRRTLRACRRRGVRTRTA